MERLGIDVSKIDAESADDQPDHDIRILTLTMVKKSLLARHEHIRPTQAPEAESLFDRGHLEAQ